MAIKDVHRQTAAQVFDIPPENVTAEQRRAARKINFMPRFCEIDFDPDDWFDSSGSAASCLTPGYDIDSAIERAARRVERKPRLDELDEQ